MKAGKEGATTRLAAVSFLFLGGAYCHKEARNPQKEREDLVAEAMLMYVCLCVCVMLLVAYFNVVSKIVVVDV